MSDFIPGTQIKRPKVTLVGGDGNAFMIVGTVQRALRRAGVPDEVVTAFKQEATSGDYDNVLTTCMKFADIE